MSSIGHITLIGAGPGDPGLITVKGLEAIQRADVVVYDKLANPRLLKHARADAELIYVGKAAGKHTVPQDGINRILVEKASAGKYVARLKGGDPFIFGRGQEELDEAIAAGITFDVVPGVTAAAGASAYAGLPLTVRAVSTSVTLVTGHEDPTKGESQVDWPALAKAGGTLVVYMGVGNLPDISSSLIAGGLAPDTPAAVVRKATLPEQRTVSSTISEIADVVKREGIKPPALLIVGKIASPEQQLAWFERLPLFGQRIVVTRSRSQASTLVEQLDALGAEVLELPTIRIVPSPDSTDIDRGIRNLESYDYVAFTSTNTVDMLRARLRELGRDARAFANARIAAIGKATADRLRDIGLSADVVGDPFTAEGLLDALSAEEVSGKRVLLPRALVARNELPEGLRKRGATVDVVEAYRTVRPDSDDAACTEALASLLSGNADLITFTSSSTVTNLVELVGGDRMSDVLKTPAAVIGPVTRKTATEAGFSIEVEPQTHTIAALVDSIKASRSGATRQATAEEETTS